MRTIGAPVLGYGYESFFNLGSASPLFGEGGTWSRFAPHAHNGYLNAYIYGGLAALTAVVWLYGVLFALGFRAARRDRALAFWPLAIVIFQTVRNVTEVDVMTGARLTWSLALVSGVLFVLILRPPEGPDPERDPTAPGTDAGPRANGRARIGRNR
jgi:O-antigen ligase